MTDPQLQKLTPDPRVGAAVRQPGLSYQQVITTILDGYADRPALSERAYDIGHDGETACTFGIRTPVRRHHLRRAARPGRAVAATWAHDDVHRVEPGEFGLYPRLHGDGLRDRRPRHRLHARRERSTADDTGRSRPERDLTDTAPTAVAAAMDDLELAARFACTHTSIRSVIALGFDERIDDDREQYAAAWRVCA